MIELSIRKSLLTVEGEMDLHVDLHIERGQFVTLFGRSGAGKTSILRMIAGLMRPDTGRIRVNGEVWWDSSTNIDLKTRERRLGFVFQEYALFPNMTVREQLEFALEKRQDESHLNELLETMEMETFQHQKPDTLSGGQKQRVALARALVRKPDILLLDEPLSALDEEMRRKLQSFLKTLHQKYSLTTLLVSHDVGEVMRLSEQVWMLENGRIIKQGAPIDVFSSKKLSGKFQFTAEVLSIKKEDIVYILTLLMGSNVVKVIAGEVEARSIQVGDQVIVASKAFNPVIQSIHPENSDRP